MSIIPVWGDCRAGNLSSLFRVQQSRLCARRRRSETVYPEEGDEACNRALRAPEGSEQF